MNHYLDITLLPNEEVGHYFLWEKLYHQVHLALVEHKNRVGQFEIAAAFPQFNEMDNSLGSKLRLLATQPQHLEDLKVSNWLRHFTDYLHISSIRPVPEKIEVYVAYSRPAIRANKAREIARRMKRHNETFVQATAHFEGFKPKKTKAPFVYMQSYTKDSRFPLFIQQTHSAVVKEGSVSFDSYGLSSRGYLPKF